VFLDHQVLAHPIIKNNFKKLTKQGIESSKMAIAFAIANGNFQPEPFKGAYNNLAFHPHFTEKGKKAFYAYFGADIMDKLGTPFNTKTEDFIVF